MKILITGDFCPLYRADSVLREDDVQALFDGALNKLISNCDFKITNLEAPLIDKGFRIVKTGPALKLHEGISESLKTIGFNVVTLANNHIMDYGAEGLLKTLQLLDKNEIRYVGAGNVGMDFDVIYLQSENIRVAIVNCCENEWSTDEHTHYRANGFSEIAMFYSIKKAKANADRVIVIHHGGHEYFNLPSPRLKRTFRFFVDCGADAVVNHHTHCVSGYEVYYGKPIFYSLGNFVFDHPTKRNDVWNYGAALLFDFSSSEIKFDLSFFEQFNKSPRLKTIEKGQLPFDLDRVNETIADDDRLRREFERFVEKRKMLYRTYMEPLDSKLYTALFSRNMLPSMWSIRKKILQKNLVFCESHREMVQEILKGDARNP